MSDIKNSQQFDENEVCDPSKVKPMPLSETLKWSMDQPIYDGPTIGPNLTNKNTQDSQDTQIYFREFLEEGTKTGVKAGKKIVKNKVIEGAKEVTQQILKEVKSGKTIKDAVDHLDLDKITRKVGSVSLKKVDVVSLLLEADNLGCADSDPESLKACKERLKPIYEKIQEALNQKYEDSTQKASEWLKISEEMIKQAYGVGMP